MDRKKKRETQLTDAERNSLDIEKIREWWNMIGKVSKLYFAGVINERVVAHDAVDFIMITEYRNKN